MSDLNTLTEAIRRSGSVRRLASEIGVKPITVYQWRLRESVPAGWAAFLREKLADPTWPARQPATSMTTETA